MLYYIVVIIYAISREGNNLNENVMQLLLTSRIGDGNIARNGKNMYIYYSSVLQDYMLYKHKVISTEYPCADVKLKDNSKGYNKHGTIYYFSTYTNEKFNKLAEMSKETIIESLDYFGYLMYYLDDGAYHKAHRTMHLYCNSFTDSEVDRLIQKIYELFPIKPCRKRVDKKKDGRSYPYLYVPVDTVKAIIAYYKDFMLNEPLLHCMLYKLGLPSQTIESNKRNSLTGE